MSEIAWDDSLSVGVDLIDEQHKRLIEKLKDLSDDFKKGHEQDRILKTLGFMIDYTDFHFTAEEKVMSRTPTLGSRISSSSTPNSRPPWTTSFWT